MFCNCTLDDPFLREHDWQENPRQTALEVLLCWIEQPSGAEESAPRAERVMEFLCDRADNDPDEKLRQFAQEQFSYILSYIEFAQWVLNVNYLCRETIIILSASINQQRTRRNDAVFKD